MSILNPTGNPHAVYRYHSGGAVQGIAPGHSYQGGSPSTLRAKCRCGAELTGLREVEAHEALARSWRRKEQ